jgi:hypothetical protein
MTRHVIRELEDGTRVYSNYTRYKPVIVGSRVRNKRKPEDPLAVYSNGHWFLPLSLIHI